MPSPAARNVAGGQQAERPLINASLPMQQLAAPSSSAASATELPSSTQPPKREESYEKRTPQWSTTGSQTLATTSFSNSSATTTTNTDRQASLDQPTLSTAANASASSDRFPHLGPVKRSLFDHVPTDWWMSVFGDEIYLKTDGDVVEDPAITKAECEGLAADAKLAAIFKRAATASAQPVRVLDLCCGQGRHSIELSRMFPELYIHGHDSSSFLINLAKERSSEMQRTQFTVGDCRYVPAPDAHFDLCIVMGNSFGYFAQDQNNLAVLTEIFRVLKPGGVVVLDLANPDLVKQQQIDAASRSWEWIDDAGKFLCVRERETSKDGRRVASRETVIDTAKGVVRDNFYEERLYESRELRTILSNAGFELERSEWARLEVDANGDIVEVTDSPPRSSASSCPSLQDKETWNLAQMSQRNQDLGMMAQRVLFKGTKKAISSSSTTTKSSSTPLATTIATTTLSSKTKQAMLPKALLQGGETLPPSLAVITGDPRRPCREKLNGQWNPEDIDTQERMLKALRAIGYVDGVTLFHLHDHAALAADLKSVKADLIFNLCDEGYENDATKELHVPSLLDVEKLPYTGAGPISLAVCYDKQWVNATAAKLAIDIPFERYVKINDNESESNSNSNSEYSRSLEKKDNTVKEKRKKTTAASLREQLSREETLKEAPWPLFIKPIKGDNSIGITCQSICHTESDVVRYLHQLTEAPYYLDEFLLQEYLEGEEYTVGIIGNAGAYTFLPILQLDYSKLKARNLAPIQGYEAKWDPESAHWTDIGYKKADLPRHQVETLQQDCIRLFERFLCRDYARFDFRASSDGRRIKLLEVNPNPGWCWDGKMAKMVQLEMGAAGADIVQVPSTASPYRPSASSSDTAAPTGDVTRAYVELLRRILVAAWREQQSSSSS